MTLPVDPAAQIPAGTLPTDDQGNVIPSLVGYGDYARGKRRKALRAMAEALDIDPADYLGKKIPRKLRPILRSFADYRQLVEGTFAWDELALLYQISLRTDGGVRRTSEVIGEDPFIVAVSIKCHDMHGGQGWREHTLLQLTEKMASQAEAEKILRYLCDQPDARTCSDCGLAIPRSPHTDLPLDYSLDVTRMSVHRRNVLDRQAAGI